MKWNWPKFVKYYLDYYNINIKLNIPFDEFVSILLWEKTAYPIADLKHNVKLMLATIRKMRRENNNV